MTRFMSKFTDRENYQLCCFGIHLTVSIISFILLTLIHALITGDELSPVLFIVPVFAGIVIGTILARNKVLQTQLLIMANTDKLTGAYNRQYFDIRLNEEMDRAKRYHTPLSIIYLDLDFFKKVNDQFGHKVGDSVLSDFAKLNNKLIRESDVFARFGGEEFIILAQMANKDAARTLYERIRLAIEQHAFEAKQNITFSAGIAELDSETDTLEGFIDRADKALYKAKETGRNKAIVAD